MVSNNATYTDCVLGLLDGKNEVGNTFEEIFSSIEINPLELMTSSVRLMDPEYLVGELCFTLANSNELDFISYYSKFWNKIADNGIIRSAYGWIAKKGYGFPQINNVISTLAADKNSRQAVILIFMPKDISEFMKDTICTLNVQFLIRDNKLHMVVNMRSNDVILGLPYDAALFSMWHQIIYNALKHIYGNLELGKYIHRANSLHLYQKNIPELKLPIKPMTFDFVLDENFLNYHCIKTLLCVEESLRLNKHVNPSDIMHIKSPMTLSFMWILCKKHVKFYGEQSNAKVFTSMMLALYDNLDTGIMKLYKTRSEANENRS